MMLGRAWPAVVIVGLAVAGCHGDPPNLRALRDGFTTHLIRHEHGSEAPPAPPPGVLELVKYRAPLGEQWAYVTPRPADHQRHPAVLWIFGGFDNDIDATAWTGTPDNDQSAQAFRNAGLVLMLPSRRGGNDNPGERESLYGEVDDVIAAADYLASLDYVDPDRIYLGGHSTGGTLALLVGETTPRFRDIFAFGPVAHIGVYGQEPLSFDVHDRREAALRSPVTALSSITTPTQIFEGAEQPSNRGSLPVFEKHRGSAPITVFAVKGRNHFSTLDPLTRMIAAKLAALPAGSPLVITPADVDAAVANPM